MLNNYINHIVFLIDASGSMRYLSDQVVRVFDNQIKHLAERSKVLDQETRVSIYLFSDKVECLVYDKDCLRLPSLSGLYRAAGNTALVDATLLAVKELEQTATLHGDHSFLFYAISDGQSNADMNRPDVLSAKLKSLPENWTVAVFVPDQNGVYEAKHFGYPSQNISVWNTSSSTAVEDAGQVMRQATESFMKARTTGVKGTKNLFSMDTSALTTTAVKQNLVELSPSSYHLLTVHSEAIIKPFIESWKIEFRAGQAYYQLTKPEKVQGYKQVCIQDKLTGKIYGGNLARELLGLPDQEVKVGPAQHPKYNLFLQSSSVNRKLVAGTQLLVMK